MWVKDRLAYDEIRREQDGVYPIINPASFALLCAEIGQDYKDDLVWEPEACDALQSASEEFLIHRFHDQNSLAIHAHRSYISPNDARFSSHLSSADRFIKIFPPNRYAPHT
jgi:histone H3/H4